MIDILQIVGCENVKVVLVILHVKDVDAALITTHLRAMSCYKYFQFLGNAANHLLLSEYYCLVLCRLRCSMMEDVIADVFLWIASAPTMALPVRMYYLDAHLPRLKSMGWISGSDFLSSHILRTSRRICCTKNNAGQTRFTVYRHRPHDFLKIFHISYCTVVNMLCSRAHSALDLERSNWRSWPSDRELEYKHLANFEV